MLTLLTTSIIAFALLIYGAITVYRVRRAILTGQRTRDSEAALVQANADLARAAEAAKAKVAARHADSAAQSRPVAESRPGVTSSAIPAAVYQPKPETSIEAWSTELPR